MSEDIVKIDAGESSRQEMRLVAVRPEEMQANQAQLMAWAERRLASESARNTDLKDNLEIAERNRWRTVTLKHELDISSKRIVAFEKLKVAIGEGYVIIPDFPITLFAIRTNHDYPVQRDVVSNSQWASRIPDEKAQLLPEGEGEYVNPKAEIESHTTHWTDQQNVDHAKTRTSAVGFQDVEFPFVMAKPSVLNATTRAMTMKIFDEIGICPPVEPYQKATQTYRGNFKKDPMIIGRIYVPRKGGKRHSVSFMIAWFLDESMLP